MDYSKLNLLVERYRPFPYLSSLPFLVMENGSLKVKWFIYSLVRIIKKENLEIIDIFTVDESEQVSKKQANIQLSFEVKKYKEPEISEQEYMEALAVVAEKYDKECMDSLLAKAENPLLLDAYEKVANYKEPKDKKAVVCTVRAASATDYAAVNRLYTQVQELHAKWRPDIYKTNIDSAISSGVFIDKANRGEVYVAIVEDAVVGVLTIKCKSIYSEKQKCRDIIEIDTLVVKEEYRGFGIGRELVEHIKAFMNMFGYDAIELKVDVNNIDAYEMYKQCGFNNKEIVMELLANKDRKSSNS